MWKVADPHMHFRAEGAKLALSTIRFRNQEHTYSLHCSFFVWLTKCMVRILVYKTCQTNNGIAIETIGRNRNPEP